MLAKRKEERGAIEACARIKIQAAIVKATSLCLRARCMDILPDHAADPDTEEGTEDEASQGEVSEAEEDLAGQWSSFRVRDGGD